MGHRTSSFSHLSDMLSYRDVCVCFGHSVRIVERTTASHRYDAADANVRFFAFDPECYRALNHPIPWDRISDTIIQAQARPERARRQEGT